MDSCLFKVTLQAKISLVEFSSSHTPPPSSTGRPDRVPEFFPCNWGILRSAAYSENGLTYGHQTLGLPPLVSLVLTCVPTVPRTFQRTTPGLLPPIARGMSFLHFFDGTFLSRILISPEGLFECTRGFHRPFQAFFPQTMPP